MRFLDSSPVGYEDKIISMSEIDIEDDTCRLGVFYDLGALVASIRAVGLINPPVLRRQEDLKYQIVCGFRRIMSCKALGWHEIEVRVMKGTPTELDALKLAIMDNRSHRQLNVVEQARGIQKLSSQRSKGNRLKMLSSWLGFPENQKVFEKLEALSRLPRPIQASVTDDIVSFEAAVDLSGFSDKDALLFLELFKVLKLSQNKQREVIRFVQEIAILEELGPGEVLQADEIRTILGRPDLNRNEKGSQIRTYLKRCRFPALVKTEERFSKELKALKLDEHIRITAPPYFEGGLHALRMTFKSVKDFEERRKTLDAVAKNPALRRLLAPFK
ncbi:MAG: ParB N-terminal domain-containing protein [Desulfobacterales bacterium]|nr:MAG: ParB N-terminal domain-containing protein [Desulfobacterales bacterium]